MAQYTSTTASPVLKEYFDSTVEKAIVDRNTTFSWFMKNVRDVDVNPRGYYFSAKTRRNQGYGSNTLSQEGGIMPRAGTPANKKIRADYGSHFLGGEISGDIRDQKDSAALINMSKDYMRDAEESFTTFQDLYLFGNGSGSIAVVTTGYAGGSPTILTCALAQATPYGATKLVPSQRVQFINPSNGAQRTGGSVTVSTVTDVNTSTDVVTFDAVPTDVVANDIVVIEDTYGREVYGFDYYLNDSNTTYLKDGETGSAISKATNPWTKANVYDASAGSLSPSFIDAVALQTGNNRGDGKIQFSQVMLSHPVQQFNYMQLGYLLNRNINASGNNKLDLGFANVSHNGMEWRVSLNCQADRIIGLQPDTWVMPMVKKPQMYDFDGGGTSLIQKYGSDRPYDAVQFYVYSRYQIVCKAPSKNWLIKNISFTPARVRQNLF